MRAAEDSTRVEPARASQAGRCCGSSGNGKRIWAICCPSLGCGCALGWQVPPEGCASKVPAVTSDPHRLYANPIFQRGVVLEMLTFVFLCFSGDNRKYPKMAAYIEQEKPL